jgi:hypothetical protein
VSFVLTDNPYGSSSLDDFAFTANLPDGCSDLHSRLLYTAKTTPVKNAVFRYGNNY